MWLDVVVSRDMRERAAGSERRGERREGGEGKYAHKVLDEW